METKRSIVQNLLLSYREWPGDSSETLVFLHGWRSEGGVWTTVIEDLRRQGFTGRVLAPDLPGFGASQPPENYTVEDYATVVEVWLAKIGVARAIFLGHSFGGRVSIVLAATRADLVARLVLIDSAGFVNRSLRTRLLKTLSPLARSFLALSALRWLRVRLYHFLGADDALATPALTQTFRNIIGRDLSNELTQILQPTLLVWGANDKDTPPAFGMRMASCIPNSRLVVLPNAAHYSFLDAREGFVQEVLPFISTYGSTS